MRFENLVEMQQHACRQYRARELYGTRTDAGFTWTRYGEFAAQVDALRGGLATLGVGRGDTVAVVADNCVPWAVGAYAAYGLGAQYVPMYELQTADDRDYILADSAAKVVLVRNPQTAAQLRERVGTLGALQHVVALEGDGETDWPALMRRGTAAPTPVVPIDRSATAGLIYTSGTTGRPKGVVITHGNLLAQLDAVSRVEDFRHDDRSLAILPWGHLMGQIVEVHLLLYCGTSAAIVRDLTKIVDDILLVRPTLLYGVPRLFTRICDGVAQSMAARGGLALRLYRAGLRHASRAPDAPPPGLLERLEVALARRLVFSKIRARLGGRLRLATSGAAALDIDVIRFFDLLGIPIYEGYGLTETTMAVTINSRHGRRLGSVGRCLECIRIELDHSAQAGRADEGEIVVYGPCITPGYHHLPEETAKVLTADGGFRTGDIGRLDADGYLTITGRIKEIYKLTNGKYVAPAPVEEALQRCPLIAQVMIYGDNRPFNVALVVPDRAVLGPLAARAGVDLSTPGWTLDPRIHQLIAAEFAARADDMRHFEHPRKFVVVDEEWTAASGQLTPTLKLKRRVILERHRDEIQRLYAA